MLTVHSGTGYTKLVERAGSILQMNEELDVIIIVLHHHFCCNSHSAMQTTAVFDMFLEAQSQGDPEAVQILAPLRLRYFTPSELLRIFGFNAFRSDDVAEDEFLWPANLTAKTRYKLIGNSVNVCVVTKLLDYLYE